MRPTVRPILRALDACVFHHIVAFQCGHINFGSRRYKVYVCSQRSWPLIGAEIFVGKSVDGGMRNDSSPNVRGIAIVIIVKSVKGHIAGNDFLRVPRIDYAAQGYQSCWA